MDIPFKGADIHEKTLRLWRPDLLAPHDEFTRDTQETLLSRVRDLYRNNPLAKSILKRLCDNIIGTGLKLRVSINAEKFKISKEEGYKLENEISDMFAMWSENCDFYRINTFNSLQYLVCFEYFLAGECLVNTPIIDNKLKLQVIEAEYIDNPTYLPDTEFLKNGIRLDKHGIPISVFIREHHPNDYNVVPIKWKEVPYFGSETGQRRLCHLFRQERSGLYRGVPPLSNVMSHLKSLEKFTDAELAAAIITSYLAVFVKKNTPPASPYAYTGVSEDTDQRKKEIELINGTIIDLDMGEDISLVNPTRPNDSFGPFYEEILNQCTGSFGIAPEIVKIMFTSTYSASKGAILQTWKTVLAERSLIIDKVLNPIFKLFLIFNIINNKINLPLDDESIFFIKPHWIGTGKDEVDEFKAIQAAEKRIAVGLSSIQRETEEIQGDDWLGVTNQRTVETRIRQQAGLEDIHINEVDKPPLSAEEIDRDELIERGNINDIKGQ